MDANNEKTEEEKIRRAQNRKQWAGRKLERTKTEDLYDADPECEHEVVALGSGVGCIHCKGWFCY